MKLPEYFLDSPFSNVVLCRFFGGTKLGTGGLVRAYGKVTTDCLKDAEIVIIKAKVLIGNSDTV